MAIIVRGAANNSVSRRRAMSLEEFKRWLKSFDADGNGRISRDELREAMRTAAGKGWFSGWKSKRGIRAADANGNGSIDDDEISSLKDFAQKYLRIRIVDSSCNA